MFHYIKSRYIWQGWKYYHYFDYITQHYITYIWQWWKHIIISISSYYSALHYILLQWKHLIILFTNPGFFSRPKWFYKLGLCHNLWSIFSSNRVQCKVIVSVWYSSSELLNCRSLPNPDPPPKGDQVFCLTKLNSVIGNLSPLLSTIRYDYHSRLLLKPNPPKNLRAKSYLKYRQSFFFFWKVFFSFPFQFLTGVG